MLFIDKYNIDSEKDIIFNHDNYQLMKLLSKNDTIPHITVTGESGSGKKSIVNYYIKEKFGLEKIKTNLKNITIKCSNKEIEFSFMYSNYHYLIEPSKYGVYDKQIIQYILEDILKYRPINKTNYHLIVVNNADRLTIEAQQSLRRTLEKFIYNCRFIFLVNSNNSMIDPIRSRCLIVKLNSPTKQEILQILTKITKIETINSNPETLMTIVNYTSNLKEAINQLQLLSTFQMNLTDNKQIAQHLYLKDNCYVIAHVLIKNSGRDIDISDLIIDIRKQVQELLTECVDPILVIKRIFRHLFECITSDQICNKMIQYTNQYIKYVKQCNKPIYAIEGFCIQIYDMLDNSSTNVAILPNY